MTFILIVIKKVTLYKKIIKEKYKEKNNFHIR